jgi:hypothetical protein
MRRFRIVWGSLMLPYSFFLLRQLWYPTQFAQLQGKLNGAPFHLFY